MAEPQSTVWPEELQIEEWRPVPGYERLYEVSSMGRVRRIAAGGNTHPGKVLRPINHNGYRCVKVHNRRNRIHRLVTLAFIGPIAPGQEVNHKNGDKADNRLCNLEYVTHAENVAHARANGLTPPFERRGLRHCPSNAVRGINHPRAKLTEDQVKEMRRARAIDSVPVRELARRYALSYGAVQQIINRRTWRHVK